LITVLAGGTGSAKLVRGLAAVTKELTVISNVGDNIWLHGLYVCPDIDTVTYALANILDERRGWGIRGDSFNLLHQLGRLGAETWFALGDRDLATHIVRTQMLRDGHTLSEVTDLIARRFGISSKIIPCTDDPLTTVIDTEKGNMHLQEFWVKNRGSLRVKGVTFVGSRSAIPNKNAIAAIRKASKVIIAPANPISSIGPTLSIAGISEELTARRKKIVAVSPIIGKGPVSGPAAKYLGALGLPATPAGVAKYYSDCVGALVIAESDRHMTTEINRLGMQTFETDIMMKNRQAEIRLARYLVERL
jgi:LPPG:FO 2-phospho-L-lactate transferase